MSRAVNLALPEENVRAACEAGRISISAIEPLPSGGTHVVCTTGEGADEIRKQFSADIIPGIVRRFPFYRARGPW
jgi:hypothetical protein